MGRHCSAFGCTNSSIKESCKKKGISFHFFPKDKILLRRWLINVRRANFQSSECSLLCSEHFTDDNFVYQPFTNRRQLKKDAIPTVFSFKQEEYCQTIPEKSSDDSLSSKDRDGSHDSCDSTEFINSDIDSDELEEDNSALLDVSMNEKFYSPEQVETSTSGVSNYSILNLKSPGVDKKKKQLKKQLKAKICLKTLKKQWLDAEIKAATAKKDYYETKNVMLSKLQNNLDLENSSEFETSTALQTIKVHLKKEELASKIENKVLKQQLEDAKITANNSEKEFYEVEFGISFSDDHWI